MNSRQRFCAFVHDEPVDHVPDFEFWFWDATLIRWASEGMDPELVTASRLDWCNFFGFEYIDGVPLKTRFVREPAETLIAEDEDTVTVRNEIGEELKKFKPGKGESIPTHMSYAVKTREDWIRVRDEFLPADIEKRLPKNWDELKAKFADPNFPHILNTPQFSMYGFLRNLMGVEEISVAIALEPEWVEEMMDHMLEIYLQISQRMVDEGIKPDMSGWWEDMCFNTGPLISPQMFKDFMVPRYKKVTDFWRANGVDRAIVDSDGNIHALTPLWVEAGVNIILPCEAAHTNVLKLRQDNPGAYLCGGIDKRQLARGRDAIDAELEKMKRVMDLGRYMPHADHLIPPDVSFADYMYYREKKQKLLGK